jgi:hypothetical protein
MSDQILMAAPAKSPTFTPGLFDDLLLHEPERCHQMARDDAAGVPPEERTSRSAGALAPSERAAIAESMGKFAQACSGRLFLVRNDTDLTETIETEA